MSLLLPFILFPGTSSVIDKMEDQLDFLDLSINNFPSISLPNEEIPTTAMTALKNTSTVAAAVVNSLPPASLSLYRTDMKLMPLTNSVDQEIYDHSLMTSSTSDSWVQFVVVTSAATTVIFLIIFTAILASYTLSQSAAVVISRPSPVRLKSVRPREQLERNPMLAETSIV